MPFNLNTKSVVIGVLLGMFVIPKVRSMIGV